MDKRTGNCYLERRKEFNANGGRVKVRNTFRGCIAALKNNLPAFLIRSNGTEIQFQPDNAPAHNATSTGEWLANNQISIMR